jgi:CubicO group peptidase (beta-lactamase class C family)
VTFQVARIEGFDVVVPSRSEALFAAGSISKFVTALGALLLVDRGVLELDADVRGTTLRALLGHTSGASVEFFPGYARDAQLPTIDDVLAGHAPATNKPVQLDDEARGAFRYSGGGYALVQRMVEDAVRVPFARAMHDAVLSPLGMHDSTFEQPLPSALHSRVTRDDWHVYPEAAAAGLWTTPMDLARAVAAVQAALAGMPIVVPRRVALAMTVPQAEVPQSSDIEAIRELGLAPPEEAGLGVFLSAGGTRFGHLGGAHGFTSAFDVSATDGTGVVVMSDVHNGFELVLPQVVEALAERVGAPVGTWRA